MRTKAATSHLLTPLSVFIHHLLIHFAHPPRLLIDFQNSKWLTHFCILCIIMHLLIISLIWFAYFLSQYYFFHINQSLVFVIYFMFLSDEEPTFKTLDFAFYIGFLYFYLFIFRFVSQRCLRSTLHFRFLPNVGPTLKTLDFAFNIGSTPTFL